MSSNYLAVLLKDYPFVNGEPYFHEELKRLSMSFDHVYLFVNHQPASDSEFRFSIPDNVSVTNIAVEQRSGLALLPLLQSGIADIFLDIKKLLTRLRGLNYYAKQAHLLETSITTFLKENGVDPGSMTWYSYWSDELAFVLTQMKRKQIIRRGFARTHSHDIYETRHPGNFLPYRTSIFGQLDGILCISNHGKNLLASQYPKHRDKFGCERLGICNNQSLEQSAPRELIELVSLSGIVPVKQLELMIEVFSLWSGNNIRWHHIGSGKDRAYEDSIVRSAAEKLDKKENITYVFHGFIKPENVIDKLSTINPHFLLNTSTFEGIPVSMMEACSLGIPIIGPDVCGVPEIIEHWKNGYLFSPTNPDELLSILHEIENLEESEYQDLRVNALNMQRQRFNADTNYNRLAAILKGETKVG